MPKMFGRRGYVMMEVLIALFIAGMIAVFLGTFLQSAIGLHLFSSKQTTSHYEVLHVLQQLEKDVRGAKSFSSSGAQLNLTDSVHKTIRYTFYDGVVSRAYNLGSPVPMTEGISDIHFQSENGLLHAVIATDQDEFHLLVGTRL